MKVIRDNSLFGGIAGTALCIDWGLRRCNWEGSRKPPNTIIQGALAEAPIFALCEEHYQIGNVPGGAVMQLEFDNFDAFAECVKETTA